MVHLAGRRPLKPQNRVQVPVPEWRRTRREHFDNRIAGHGPETAQEHRTIWPDRARAPRRTASKERGQTRTLRYLERRATPLAVMDRPAWRRKVKLFGALGSRPVAQWQSRRLISARRWVRLPPGRHGSVAYVVKAPDRKSEDGGSIPPRPIPAATVAQLAERLAVNQ